MVQFSSQVFRGFMMATTNKNETELLKQVLRFACYQLRPWHNVFCFARSHKSRVVTIITGFQIRLKYHRHVLKLQCNLLNTMETSIRLGQFDLRCIPSSASMFVIDYYKTSQTLQYSLHECFRPRTSSRNGCLQRLTRETCKRKPKSWVVRQSGQAQVGQGCFDVKLQKEIDFLEIKT